MKIEGTSVSLTVADRVECLTYFLCQYHGLGPRRISRGAEQDCRKDKAAHDQAITSRKIAILSAATVTTKFFSIASMADAAERIVISCAPPVFGVDRILIAFAMSQQIPGMTDDSMLRSLHQTLLISHRIK